MAQPLGNGSDPPARLGPRRARILLGIAGFALLLIWSVASVSVEGPAFLAFLDTVTAWRLDAVALAVLGFGGLWAASRRLRIHGGLKDQTRLTAAAVAAVIVTGTIVAELFQRAQAARLVAQIAGLAPTYAAEMARLGHGRLALDALPDDPLYLLLIETEKQWLATNPSVADIYTFRRRADEQIVLVVDSETDYDRDGRFEGEREQRTSIGEEYDESYEQLAEAFSGRSVFDAVPVTDRWGAWVSAFEPIRDRDGNVEAVLGVDYPARSWVSTALVARWSTLGVAGVAAAICVAWYASSGLRRAELKRRIESEAQLQQLSDRLAAAKAHLQAIFDSEPECVKLVGPDYLLQDMNPAGLAMIEAGSIDQVRGRSVLDMITPEFQQRYRDGVAEVFRGGRMVLEFEIVGLGGKRRWMEEHAVGLRDAQDSGRVTLMLAVSRDVTDRKRAEGELRSAARTDKLTALPNRALFHERLQRAVSRARAHPEYRFAVLFIDLDRFKIINDSLGHEVGDLLLQRIAERLRSVVRPGDSLSRAARGDTAARLGGDEFVLLLDGLTDTRNAAVVAERLLSSLSMPYQVGEHQVHATASIGIVNSDSDIGALNADELLRNADIAMYEAKAAGKARYVVFDDSMHERVRVRLQLENDLRSAVEAGQLQTVYQPIVQLGTGRVTSFEALARWTHPTRGQVSPGEFIPIAEEVGLIVPLGHFVLREALGLLKGLRRDPAGRALSVNVNLSRRQLFDPGFLPSLQSLLDDCGVPPERLCLEITESAVMDRPGEMHEAIRALKALGVHLHMDDFGVGLSSLSLLRNLPLDGLKIDRSFIEAADGDRRSVAVLHAIISLGRSLGKTITAEGVSERSHLASVLALECDFAQGYYFSRPVAAEHTAAMLRPGFFAAAVAAVEPLCSMA